MENQKLHRNCVLAAGALLLVMCVLSPTVWAMTKPADDKQIGYFVYQIVFNQIFKGPIGYIGGLGTVVFSATQIAKNWMLALLGIVGGSCWMNADKIVEALGAML